MSSDTTPLILVTIDGLRASALGPYGQTTFETPAFDAFAAEGVTHDWVYAPTPDLKDLLLGVRSGEKGVTTSVVTDDPEVAKSVERFAEVETFDIPSPDQPADELDQTTAAAVWARFTEAVVEAYSEERPDAPTVLWLHTRGLYGPWDAPPTLFEPLLDADDPEVVPNVVPPNETSSSDQAADARFAAACRYTAQVMTLDACFAGWLDVVDALFEGIDHRIAVAGVRGFPLGEHGQIGGVDERLFSEQQHVPLLMRDTSGGERFMRCQRPKTLNVAVTALLSGQQPTDNDSLVLTSDLAKAVVTDSWMLRTSSDGSDELYVKPDDRWEQNDVASLDLDTVDELNALLAAQNVEKSDVAAPAEDQ